MPVEKAEPKFFATPAGWRRWLERNHDKREFQWVGFWKVGSGRKSITWKQAVDEALCFGWIDGVRRSVDAESYTNRFTPRKPTSNWSDINVARVKELTAEGRMRAAGLAAFAKRKDSNAGPSEAALTPALAKTLKRNAKAQAWFDARAPWYRRAAIRWVMSAKQEATRERRLATLVRDCEAGQAIKPLRRPTKAKG